MRKLRILPALALALSLTSACTGASGSVVRGGPGGDPGPSSQQVEIIVENNLVPSTSVTIHSVGTQGARRLVGTVPPGTTRTLRFRAGTLVERYSFVASVGISQNLTSNPLSLSGGDTVRWQLNSNTISVQ
jgi:hypothetical protein